MLTTKQVEIIIKNKFAKITLEVDNKTFVAYVKALARSKIMLIYSFYKAQFALVISTKIFAKYSDLSNIFSSNPAIKLLEYTEINDHPIDLLNNKQPF